MAAIHLESTIYLGYLLYRDGVRKQAMFVVHHAATLALIGMSWAFGLYEVGSLVLWLHDASDIGIDLLKMCGGLRFEAALIPIFVVHFVVWVWLRLILYGRCVIFAAFEQEFAWFSGDVAPYPPSTNWLDMRETWIGWVNIAFLLALYCLHWLWTVESVKKAWEKLNGAAALNMPAACIPEPAQARKPKAS